jgi:hypothetical protein
MLYTFSGNVISVGGCSWVVPYPVADARGIGDRIVVIYDYLSGPKNAAFHKGILNGTTLISPQTFLPQPRSSMMACASVEPFDHGTGMPPMLKRWATARRP